MVKKNTLIFIQKKGKDVANSFEKDLFKLINNCTSGEAIKNLRKRIRVRLVNNAAGHKKCVNKRSFVSQKIFNKHSVATHEIKPVLTLDKPTCVRFGILDLRKFLMYEFYYKSIIVVVYRHRQFSL